MGYNNRKIEAPTVKEKWIIRVLILIGLLSLLYFLYFFFQPAYRGYSPLYIPLSIIIGYGALKQVYLWYHYLTISVPELPESTKKFTVDILTTYFPGEPYEMILETLTAIQNIEYPHTTYLCDEANDPYLIEVCKEMGVVHVTRNNRIDAKAGNINNALKQATGEICLILDPDHIPKPNFLDKVLPYFSDENIGYVQVVQAYYNKPHTLVARGAAEQTFQFYGPIMMSMNSYGTVNAIGANCTFRRKALDSIGGHAPGLAEDMHTAMLLHAKGWKSVYAPELIAKGLAPADITSYFKQQLKWSRGTFELLYVVYPKIFKNFTWRQKIHYALLPLHYAIGFIYLLNFLIPIGSLFLSKMPWTGNILYFFAASIPLFVSSLLIGTYIQKWVIEKGDRGFHVIGGLLQIAAWWVFLLGIIYTFFRKNVPYLPTPKSEGAGTSIFLMIPNLIVALLSIAAIIYGLNVDLTPFTICMSIFAALNVIFMCFSFYLSNKITNKNQILRKSIKRDTIDKMILFKNKVIDFSDFVFNSVRKSALLLVVLVAGSSFYITKKLNRLQWEEIGNEKPQHISRFYTGIFSPSSTEGKSNLNKTTAWENNNKVTLDIVSHYYAWSNDADTFSKWSLIEETIDKGKIPMITWEPWTNSFQVSDSILELKANRKVFKNIVEGNFDEYLIDTAKKIKTLKSPILLRFAHEFDNPAYPWSLSGDNTPEEFINAWRYVVRLFREQSADNIYWVWNPWHSSAIQSYFPGDDYVDWVGVDILNYEKLNKDGVGYSFKELYASFHDKLKSVTEKPVIIAEFGTLNDSVSKNKWVHNAFESIEKDFKEIKGLVLFNSSYDKNIPENNFYSKPYLDWTIAKISSENNSIFNADKNNEFNNKSKEVITIESSYVAKGISKNLRGVNYKKTQNWVGNQYVGSKDVLQKDFQMMNDLGINFIKVQHSPMYAYNLLKYAGKAKLKVTYNFELPTGINMVKDTLKVEKFKKEILSTITKLKGNDAILGWSFGNSYMTELNSTYFGIGGLDQRIAYFNWLKELIDSIKVIDSGNLIIVDIEEQNFTHAALTEYLNFNLSVDVFGIPFSNSIAFNESINKLNKSKIPFYFVGVSATDLSEDNSSLIGNSIVLQNWQNQLEYGHVSLDGLLDFEGKKTVAYEKIRQFVTNEIFENKLPEISIIRPAKPLYEGNIYTYHAYYKFNDDLIKSSKHFNIESKWSLIKLDKYGEMIAIKELGKGVEIQLKIPKNYNRYKILLTSIYKGYSIQKATMLNTPFSEL
ncbi:glycosyltransferase [Maribacter aquivivus]|uniref:glycosyltransferase n=1 Tax=Maribacter aquivivus TaxID=228958 RepID=UPI0024919D58|nr:glycosyltransferase [Maribacter aquivivus]